MLPQLPAVKGCPCFDEDMRTSFVSLGVKRWPKNNGFVSPVDNLANTKISTSFLQFQSGGAGVCQDVTTYWFFGICLTTNISKNPAKIKLELQSPLTKVIPPSGFDMTCHQLHPFSWRITDASWECMTWLVIRMAILNWFASFVSWLSLSSNIYVIIAWFEGLHEEICTYIWPSFCCLGASSPLPV